MSEPAIVIPKVDDLVRRLPLLRAWRLLRERDAESPRKSFIVEFAGMPKAGKTSSIDVVRHFFRHAHGHEYWKDKDINLRYEVDTPAEGVSQRTPALLKDDHLDFNAWAGAYGLQELLQASHDSNVDLALLDRGPWDASCWLEYWRKSEDSLESKLIEFFRLEPWMVKADLHVVFVVDPVVAASRESSYRLISHGGFSSDKDDMIALRKIYDARFEELRDLKATAKDCSHVGELAAVLVDTTAHASPAVTARWALGAIFDVLEAKVNARSGDLVGDATRIGNQLFAYRARMGAKVQGELDRFINDEFVPSYDALPPWKRVLVDESIKSLAMPEMIAQGRRVKLEDVVAPLKRILRDAESY